MRNAFSPFMPRRYAQNIFALECLSRSKPVERPTPGQDGVELAEYRSEIDPAIAVVHLASFILNAGDT
jgi:hypothetical protein